MTREARHAAFEPTGERRLLLLGASGQVGRAVRAACGERWHVDAPASSAVSLQDPGRLAAYIRDSQPHAIVSAAAFTRVDDAEAERDIAFRVNGEAPGVIGEVAREIGARVVHISTDYVFDGRGGAPYRADAPTSPVSVYGASKLEGERRLLAAAPDALVLRTAWVHDGVGTNFVGTAVRVLTSGTTMRVVDDQIGTPTRAANLARAVAGALETADLGGVLHWTDCGVASWFDVAHCVLETLRAAGRVNASVSVVPVPSLDFPRPAPRPMVGVLDKHAAWRTLGWIPPHWRDGIVTSTLERLNA